MTRQQPMGIVVDAPVGRAVVRRSRKRRKGFIAHTIKGLSGAIEHASYSDALAKSGGLLQRLDPRVKVAGMLALIIAAALARNAFVILGVFSIAVLLALGSHVSLRTLAAREWLGIFLFTGSIALPAIFITPGDVLCRLPWLDWPITAQGVRSAIYLVARVETAATLSLLLILCTPWTHVLKALRIFRVPVVFVVILGMTYRYIFLMLQTALDMFESRQSRLVGELDGPEGRRLAAASVGVLLSKSLDLSSEVYLAMQSRGFRGEVYTLDEFRMQPHDWVAAAGFTGAALAAFWFR